MTTPRLEALAAEGARFAQAYATNFWTLPSHAALLTGLYPSEAGATSETNNLPATVTTLAERLSGAGYCTGGVVCNGWLSEERGFRQGFADYVEMWRRENWPQAAASTVMIEQAATERAMEWMRREARKDTPFFLFVNFNIAHLPYTPPPQVLGAFLPTDAPADRVAWLQQVKGMWPHLAGAMPLSDEDYRIMRALYEAEIAVADHFVGQLVDTLAKTGILDETLVIVTSDHGENIGDHGMIDHLLSMYDTTLHVPLIMRYPARFAAGTTVSNLVSQVDVVPTVLDVCGLVDETNRAHVEEVSLASSARTRREFVVAENERPVNGVQLLKKGYPSFDTRTIDHPMRMVRTPRHKVIVRVGVGAELYDLDADPGETHDIAAAAPDTRDSLLTHLDTWQESLGRRQADGLFESRDTEALEQLRRLGYIE